MIDMKAIDAHYGNPKLARLYDLDSGWSNERDFYVALAGNTKKNILDLGCGTGLICNRLAELGHNVTGIDPAAIMLEQAKNKPYGNQINWVCSTAQDFKSENKFDLIIMTGNAFQVLLEEKDLSALFKNVKRHLKPDGVFAFETRNPQLDWPSIWNYADQLETPEGTVLESRRFLSLENDRMKFELLYEFPDQTMVSQSELRFWHQEEIGKQVQAADLFVDRLLGDWDGKPLDPARSKEMVFFVKTN